MTKENNSIKQTGNSQKSDLGIKTFTHRCPINKPNSSARPTNKEKK